MIITLDTNILFSALYSSAGASYQILNLVVDEKIKMAITTPIFFEYYEILTRTENLSKFNLLKENIEDILDLLALLSKKHSIYYLLRPNLLDESDNIFFECAFASNSDFLITSNVKDFESSELKGFTFKIVKPNEFLSYWRKNNE
jgi:putative PIN family toxin of toxin-antitoxin system